MIVDLVRHDLGRVSSHRSVTVPELLSPCGLRPGVASGVDGVVRLRFHSTCPAAEPLAATFLPAASVTERPKIVHGKLFSDGAASAGALLRHVVGLASPVVEPNAAIRGVRS